ncbi:hypothetical protein EDB81DRAFT_776969 [Dactylonectria macrodidyma]|uniref:Secreted protein n=1 Tax=Dactylonectria macrodidyma TaxID=307937 RepID=A0A9P9FS06_9HYPO|nr:hypothetical protein EDB81DRAFT_776969 [Dactylonectria macrodidyma]
MGVNLTELARLCWVALGVSWVCGCSKAPPRPQMKHVLWRRGGPLAVSWSLGKPFWCQMVGISRQYTHALLSPVSACRSRTATLSPFGR